MAILYPKKVSKVFLLPINKLPLDQLLEKLDALFKDSQLHEAINPKGVLQLKECLDNGANINNKNTVGDTVLHIATRKDYFPIVSLFLEKGASINISNHNGETPLWIVDQKNDAIMRKAFLETIVDPKAKKPDLTMQVLMDYWDERIQKLANKPMKQSFVEEAVEGVPSPKKKLVQFFFSKTSTRIDQQQPEEAVIANLVK